MCRATRGDRRILPCVLKLSFQNLAEMRTAWRWRSALFFHHYPGAISRGRLRNLGPCYTRSSKISRNMGDDFQEHFQLAFIGPRARSSIPVSLSFSHRNVTIAMKWIWQGQYRKFGPGDELGCSLRRAHFASARGPSPRVNLVRGFVCHLSRRVRCRGPWMKNVPLHGARRVLETFSKQTFGAFAQPTRTIRLHTRKRKLPALAPKWPRLGNGQFFSSLVAPPHTHTPPNTPG